MDDPTRRREDPDKEPISQSTSGTTGVGSLLPRSKHSGAASPAEMGRRLVVRKHALMIVSDRRKQLPQRLSRPQRRRVAGVALVHQGGRHLG